MCQSRKARQVERTHSSSYKLELISTCTDLMSQCDNVGPEELRMCTPRMSKAADLLKLSCRNMLWSSWTGCWVSGLI